MWTSRKCVIAAFLFWSHAVCAAPNCEDDHLCSQLSQEGRVAHNQEKEYAVAVARYQSAYSLVKDPRLLLLMGRSLQKLGNFSLALQLYQQAEPELTDPNDIARLRQFAKEALTAKSIAPTQQETDHVQTYLELEAQWLMHKTTLPRSRKIAAGIMGSLGIAILASSIVLMIPTPNSASLVCGKSVTCQNTVLPPAITGITVAAGLGAATVGILLWPVPHMSGASAP